MKVICENKECVSDCYHSTLHEYDDEECNCVCAMCDEFYKCIPILNIEQIQELDRILEIC